MCDIYNDFDEYLIDNPEDIFSIDGDTSIFDLVEYTNNQRIIEIKQGQRLYLEEKVDWKKSRFPSKWLDELRERNKCPFCVHWVKNPNNYNEYDEGIVMYFNYDTSRVARPECPVCNPPCLVCMNERFKNISHTRRGRNESKVECPSCYCNKDIWRIKSLEQLQELIKLREPINHLYLDTLGIPCPRCLSQTMKNGNEWKRKCKNKECTGESNKNTYTFRFKRVYEQEILKERIVKLFMQRVSYGVIEEMEKVKRGVASKWVTEWLYKLPVKDSHI